MQRVTGIGGVFFKSKDPETLRAWYLSVVNTLAAEGGVETVSIRGMWWREIDSPEDLEEVRESLRNRPAPRRVASAR